MSPIDVLRAERMVLRAAMSWWRKGGGGCTFSLDEYASGVGMLRSKCWGLDRRRKAKAKARKQVTKRK